MHAPPEHVEFVHGTPVPQLPPLLHVCTLLPEHCKAPGVQLPLQAPLTHAEFMQADGVPYWPFAPQVSTPLPLHCVWLGAQTPTHAPPTHVWFVHATGDPHVDAAVQVCTPLPRHWVAPERHATHVLFEHAGVAPEHVAWVCQFPAASHDWMRFPRHWVCPGAQTPPQAPATHVWLEHAVPLVHMPLALQV
jgi:rubredoxin